MNQPLMNQLLMDQLLMDQTLASQILTTRYFSNATIFCSHTPFFTKIKPMTHLIMSPACTRAYTAITGRLVKWISAKAMVTLTHQINTLSKKNVTTVLPPARSVK